MYCVDFRLSKPHFGSSSLKTQQKSANTPSKKHTILGINTLPEYILNSKTLLQTNYEALLFRLNALVLANCALGWAPEGATCWLCAILLDRP